MSGTNHDPNKPSGGGNPDPSGGGGGNPDPSKDTVSYDTHRKLLNEKKAQDQKLADMQARIDAIEQERKDREKAELEKQGNYKKLLEDREKELEAEKKKRADLEGEITQARKRRALLAKIDGKIPENAMSLLPMDMVEVDGEGKPTDESVTRAAQLFQKDYSWAIHKDKPGGGLPPDAPGGGVKKLTVSEWNALPAAEMKKRAGEVDWNTK